MRKRDAVPVAGRLLGLLVCLAWLWLLPARADDFAKANEHYDAGRFAEAKQLYEQLLDSGTRSANVFYNLANTDYRLGATGRAMLGYERALLLDPKHAEAGANLKLLREQSHSRDLQRSWPERILASGSENLWTLVASVAAWLTVLAVTIVWTGRRSGNAGWWSLAGIALVVALVGGLALRLHARDRALAIVTAREVEAHVAPAESAVLAGFLPAGTRVRVLSERGAWIYCELPDAKRGWVPSGAIERVRRSQS